MRVKTEFKHFRDRRKRLASKINTRDYDTDAQILAALPERSIVDAQAVLYFDTFETSYRILHEPTFWQGCRDFWQENCNGNKPQMSFAVMLVLIIAITKCLTPKDAIFIGDTTADRHAANHLIDLCESWMDGQPRKRITLQFFQIQFLTLLAKRANCIEMKQDWMASGDILRLSLASGLHRDPSSLGYEATSVYDEEMKKRLWVTIMELELQSSVDNGLHSHLTGLQFDTAPPANLADDAFSTDTLELPTSQPSEQFTSTSYLVVTTRSLPLRIHLAQLLNNPSGNIQYTDILEFDAQVRCAISALPMWNEKRAALSSGLLRLQLHQYLLMLHKPYARLPHKDGRYRYSFTTFIDTCSSIIAIHDDLLSKGILALSNLRNDVIRVGLNLSQVVYHNCARNIVGQPPPPTDVQDTLDGNAQGHFADSSIPKRWELPSKPLHLTTLPQEPFLAKILCSSSIDILEQTRQLFEQKVFRMGTAYMEYCLMSAAVDILPAQPSPTTSITYINNAKDDIPSRGRKTLDCFTNLAARVVALQQDPENSLASSLRSTIASVSPSGSRGPSLGGDGFDDGARSRLEPPTSRDSGVTPMAGIGMGSSAGGDLGNLNGYVDPLQEVQMDMSGWSFPDFWAFDFGGDF